MNDDQIFIVCVSMQCMQSAILLRHFSLLICLSVQCQYYVKTNGHIIKLYWQICYGHHS